MNISDLILDINKFKLNNQDVEALARSYNILMSEYKLKSILSSFFTYVFEIKKVLFS